MKELPAELEGTFDLVVGPEHTAEALGNEGMRVFGTPYVVWMVECAAYTATAAYLEPGEGIAGTHINLHHRAPTAIGHPVHAVARLVGRHGRRLRYEATVTADDQVIADGVYESAVVDMERMRARISQ